MDLMSPLAFQTSAGQILAMSDVIIARLPISTSCNLLAPLSCSGRSDLSGHRRCTTQERRRNKRQNDGLPQQSFNLAKEKSALKSHPRPCMPRQSVFFYSTINSYSGGPTLLSSHTPSPHSCSGSPAFSSFLPSLSSCLLLLYGPISI